MMMGRQYKNAPITEAIVEFHVVTPAESVIAALADLDFGDDYATANPTYRFQGGVQVEKKSRQVTPAETTTTLLGYSYGSTDDSRTVLADATSFAFVSKTSYTHWGDFIAEVERTWEIYKAAATPSRVTGIGVRFVNRIPMPLRPVEIKDYLRTSVDLSAYLPQSVASLFMQVDVPLEEFGATSTITSAILDSDETYPGGALLLDIDVKAPVLDGDTSSPSFNTEITTTLTRLRLAKNFVFEACITDATRGVIDS